MGEAALKLIAKARTKTGLPIVTEVMTPTDVALVAEYADLFSDAATCKTTSSSKKSAIHTALYCSNGACLLPSKSGCFRRNTS
jgi:3-deoxy-D-manno-octulosonic acid (KDO) 8-phosphate synthase